MSATDARFRCVDIELAPQKYCHLIKTQVGLFKQIITNSFQHNWFNASWPSTFTGWCFDTAKQP